MKQQMKKTMFTSPSKNQKKHKQWWWLLCCCMNMQKEKYRNQWHQPKKHSKEIMKAHRAHKPHKKMPKANMEIYKGKKEWKKLERKSFQFFTHVMGMLLDHFGNFNPSIRLIGFITRFEMINQVKCWNSWKCFKVNISPIHNILHFPPTLKEST